MQPVKGANDWYPEDKQVQQAVFNRLKAVAEAYGYREIETPVFETLELLETKQGEETRSQIFVLEKKGNEQLGLRFDLTVPATRLFVQKQRELAKPVKWFYLDKMWRYEAPQKGRLREFYQFGVELFGSGKAEADIEIVNLLIEALKSVGLTAKDFVVKINNRKLLQGLLDFIPADKFDAVSRIIDKSDKLSIEELEKEFTMMDINFRKINEIIMIEKLEELEKIKMNKLAKEGYEELKAVFSQLPKEFVKLDMSTARGLAYYTGNVFEAFDREGKFRAIAGGGRYDNLVEQYGGEKTPATGFGIGYATLSLLLQEKKKLPKPDKGVDFFIAVVNDEVREKALKICQELRKRYSVDIDLMRRPLSKQFDYANSIKAKKVIIVGPDELKKGNVKIKNMESGKEEIVKIDKI
jgi:histidyl-tRNA synthetase